MHGMPPQPLPLRPAMRAVSTFRVIPGHRVLEDEAIFFSILSKQRHPSLSLKHTHATVRMRQTDPAVCPQTGALLAVRLLVYLCAALPTVSSSASVTGAMAFTTQSCGMRARLCCTRFGTISIVGRNTRSRLCEITCSFSLKPAIPHSKRRLSSSPPTKQVCCCPGCLVPSGIFSLRHRLQVMMQTCMNSSNMRFNLHTLLRRLQAAKNLGQDSKASTGGESAGQEGVGSIKGLEGVGGGRGRPTDNEDKVADAMIAALKGYKGACDSAFRAHSSY